MKVRLCPNLLITVVVLTVMCFGLPASVVASGADTSPFRAVQLASFGKATCAITNKESVLCWGNLSGLGTTRFVVGVSDNFDEKTAGVPRVIPGLESGVDSFIPGDLCVVKKSGGVHCIDGNNGVIDTGLSTDLGQPVSSVSRNYVVNAVVETEGQVCFRPRDAFSSCVGWGRPSDRANPTYGSYVIPELPEQVDRLVEFKPNCAVSIQNRLWCYVRGSTGSTSSWQIVRENVKDAHGSCYVSIDDFLWCPLTAAESDFVKVFEEKVLQMGKGLMWGTNCAVLFSRQVKCWRSRSSQQDKNQQWTYSYEILAEPKIAKPVTNIQGTCATLESGNVSCWGLLDVDQELTKPIQIVEGNVHKCAITTIGGVTCWGDNSEGQLGDGTTKLRDSYVDVVGFVRAKKRLISTTTTSSSSTTTIASGSSTTVQSISPTTVVRGPKWRPKRPRGGVSVLVNGREIDAKFEFGSRSVRVTTPNLEMTIAEATDDEALNPDDSESLHWTVDEEIDVAVDGLERGSDVDLTMFSDPVPLHSGVAGEDGRAALKIRVPSGVSPGAHSLVIDGTISDGTAVTMVVSVVVSSAVTAGSRWTGFALAALVLAVLGALSLPASRLRRRRSRVQP